MNVRLYLLALAVFSHSAGLYANPMDYAWKAGLDSKEGELNKVSIGAAVIKGLGRDDFGDLVVLDANGSRMPSWVRPMQQVSEEIEVPLSFHTFSDYGVAHSKTVTATEESQSQASRSSIKTTETVRVAKPSNAFVVELSDYQLGLGINSLLVNWTTTNDTELLKLRVDVSNSLNNWQAVHDQVTLAKENEATDKGRDWQRVNNIPTAKRYIRLSSANPDLPMKIDSVSGFYAEPTLQTIEWKVHAPLAPEPESDRAYRFELPAGVPPTRLRLKPAQQKQIIKGSIYAGNDVYRNKRALFTDIQQHSLTPAPGIIASPSFAVPRQRYDNWWFESTTVLAHAPTLELGYTRHELIFLANGTAPYSLYWGNYEASPPAQLLRDVLENHTEIDAAFAAQLGQTHTAAGAHRQFAPSAIPWLTWALWLLLAIATVFTARMALGLFREMK